MNGRDRQSRGASHGPARSTVSATPLRAGGARPRSGGQPQPTMTAGDKNAQYVEQRHCWDMGYEIITHRDDESKITRQEIDAFAGFHIQERLTGTNPTTAELMA